MEQSNENTSQSRCPTCQQLLPAWDTHPFCFRCRPTLCSQDETCPYCELWSTEVWATCSEYLSTRLGERQKSSPSPERRSSRKRKRTGKPKKGAPPSPSTESVSGVHSGGGIPVSAPRPAGDSSTQGCPVISVSPTFPLTTGGGIPVSELRSAGGPSSTQGNFAGCSGGGIPVSAPWPAGVSLSQSHLPNSVHLTQSVTQSISSVGGAPVPARQLPGCSTNQGFPTATWGSYPWAPFWPGSQTFPPWSFSPPGFSGTYGPVPSSQSAGLGREASMGVNNSNMPIKSKAPSVGLSKKTSHRKSRKHVISSSSSEDSSPERRVDITLHPPKGDDFFDDEDDDSPHSSYRRLPTRHEEEGPPALSPQRPTGPSGDPASKTSKRKAPMSGSGPSVSGDSSESDSEGEKAEDSRENEVEESLSYVEKIRLVMATQAKHLPSSMPMKKRKMRSSLIGRSSQPESEPTPQLPLAEGIRVELSARREDLTNYFVKGKSPKSFKLPRRPKAPMAWYTPGDEDFPLNPPKPSPELSRFLRPSGPQVKMDLPVETLGQMEQASRASLLIASHTDWFLGTAHSLLEGTTKGLNDLVLAKLEAGEDVSKEDIATLISSTKGITGLLSSVAKAYEDRLTQDTYLFWALHLLRRDSYLKSLSFQPEEQVVQNLRLAPVCKEGDSIGDPGSLFRGEASSLDNAAREDRERKRDEALFKRPAPPTRSGPSKPKKSKTGQKAIVSTQKVEPQQQSQPQPFHSPLASASRPGKKSFGARGRGGRGGKSKYWFQRFLSFHHGLDSRSKSRKPGLPHCGSTFNRILASLERTGIKSMDCKSVKERFHFELQGSSPSLPHSPPFSSACLSSEATSLTRRNYGYDRKGSDRTGSHKHTRILQSSFCGPQILRGLETCDRSFGSKSIPKHSDFLHGDCGIHQEGHASGSLGNIPGPQGRLFSCSNTPQGQKISSIHVSKSNLAVQGPTLRPGPSSLDIHNDSQGGASHGSQTRVVPAPVLGRLDPEAPVTAYAIAPQRPTDCTLYSSGFHSELEKVRSRTQARLCVSRVPLSYLGGIGTPLTGETRQAHLSDLFLPGVPQTSCVSVAVVTGPHVVLGKTYSSGTPTHEVSSTRPQKAVAPVSGSGGYINRNITSVPGRSQMVDEPVQSHCGFPIPSPHPDSSSVHRCIQRGMGGTLEFPGSFRPMVGPCSTVAHQHTGVSCSVSRSVPLGTRVQEPSCSCSYGQLDGCLLYQQARGDKVLVLSSGNSTTAPVLSLQPNYTEGPPYSGQVERSGRFSLSTGSNFADRVVSVSQNFQLDLFPLGNPAGGPVCDQMESQTVSVCVANTGPDSLAGGRSVNELGPSLGICLPTNTSDPSSVVQSVLSPLSGHRSGTTLARQELVSNSFGLANRPPEVSATQVGPVETAEEFSVPQTARQSPTARVSVVQRSLRQKGFSAEVSSRISKPNRGSSLAVYQSKWVTFTAWCIRRKADPLKASVPLISEFLLEKYKAGRAPSTLDGYRTAIAKTLVHYTGIDLGANRDLSALLHNFHLERSRVRNPVPDWDLSLVLNCLLKGPFEPLNNAPLKLVTWKTVFLLALASGKRRGELHALDFKSLAYSSDGGHVFLRVIPSFLAKTQVSGSSCLSFSIPALSNVLSSGMEEDNLLCPVRALKIYLSRTQGIRENKTLLFVSYKTGFMRDIKSPTISFWLKKLIRLCYDIASKVQPGPLAVRAHDIRALSASLAFFSKVPIERVMESCTWKSHNTFTHFYLRDLTLHRDELLRLGPLVAAQVVLPSNAQS